MNTDELQHRLRDEIRSHPVPQPTEKLLAAIVLRRQTGETVPLPTDPVVRSRSGPLRWAVISAIAATLLVMLVPSSRAPQDAEQRSTNVGLFGVEMLMAQATDHPAFPVIRVDHPLPDRSVVYGGKAQDSPAIDSTYTWRAERKAVSYQGNPTYRYAYSTVGSINDRPLSDTLWLVQETFKPIIRQATAANGYRVIQEFQTGSVITGHITPTGYAEWHSEDYNTVFVHILGESKPRPAFRLASLAYQIGTWWFQILTSLEAANLSPEWRGSVEILSAPGGTWATRFWLNFQVVGEERVTVPAGTFDAWKVQVGESDSFLIWVSKDQHQVLQVGHPRRMEREVLIQSELK